MKWSDILSTIYSLVFHDDDDDDDDDVVTHQLYSSHLSCKELLTKAPFKALVCLFVYPRIHYIRTYIHTFLHTYIHTYIHAYIHTSSTRSFIFIYDHWLLYNRFTTNSVIILYKLHFYPLLPYDDIPHDYYAVAHMKFLHNIRSFYHYHHHCHHNHYH